MNTGKFFVLEGLDGSGKTTVIDQLKKEFPDILYTREPGGSPFGEKIRRVLLEPESKDVPALPFLLAFMAARASHFEEMIIPALREGRTVVSDRFDASTFSFQLCAQENRDELDHLFWHLRQEILQIGEDIIFRPRYVYLRISPEVSAERRRVRLLASGEENHFDAQRDSYHRKVFDGYEEFFEIISSHASKMISPSENIVHTVDASLSPDEVYKKVKTIIVGLA